MAGELKRDLASAADAVMDGADKAYVAAKALPWTDIGGWILVFVVAAFLYGAGSAIYEDWRARQPKPPRLPVMSAWARRAWERKHSRAGYRAWRKLQKTKSQ